MGGQIQRTPLRAQFRGRMAQRHRPLQVHGDLRCAGGDVDPDLDAAHHRAVALGGPGRAGFPERRPRAREQGLQDNELLPEPQPHRREHPAGAAHPRSGPADSLYPHREQDALLRGEQQLDNPQLCAEYVDARRGRGTGLRLLRPLLGAGGRHRPGLPDRFPVRRRADG